jgi:hypothetical protein
MASFTAFFYELLFGSNWDKSYCEDPTKAVPPVVAAVPQPVNTVDLAPALLPLISPSTFKRRRLGGSN